MKRYLYSAGAISLVGYWLWRKRRKSKELGGPESSASFTVRMPMLGLAAGKQVARALAGSSLADYRKAEDLSKFWGAPAYNVEAYYKAAYWLAVVSRLVGSRSIAASASSLMTKGGALYAVPGSSLLTGSAASIMRDAYATMKGHQSNKQVAAVLAALGQGGSTSAVRAAQAREDDREVVENSIKKSASDVGEGLEYVTTLIRDGVGLKRPNGDDPPWWRKWAIRGGVAVAVLLGLGVAFGKQIGVAKAYATSMVTRAKAAKLALTGPAV